MQKQKILIIGGGGREHAIGWKISQSERCEELYFAPGNGGTASLGTNVDIKATDIEALIEFVKKEKIDLTLAIPDDPLALGIVDEFQKKGLRIFGPSKNAAQLEASKAFSDRKEKIDLTLAIPDDPLALGIVDEFQKKGLRIFGPSKNAAQLEASKAFSKNFMAMHNLPTAKFEIFTDYELAKKYLENHSLPVVVKVSGLALGKGVFICESLEEANLAIENILVKKTFGDAGSEIVIEEFLIG